MWSRKCGAYPMAVSADWRNEEYVIIYGMADLPVDTGQGKDAQESGQEQNTGTVFRGKDMDEIHSLYDATQEYELDLGHVQAVILGDSLLGARRGCPLPVRLYGKQRGAWKERLSVPDG